MPKKIRTHTKQKVPFLLIAGDDDVAKKAVSFRFRDGTQDNGVTVEEAVADKGYHAAQTLELSESLGVRTYIPEPQRQPDRRWTDKPAEWQRAVYNNRRRMRLAKGKQLQRHRSEMCERSFAHVCDSGGTRRSWLRGLLSESEIARVATILRVPCLA